MWLVYDIIYLIGFLLYLPVFLFRRKLHPGFGKRLGWLPELKLDKPLWIHAVSVGEAVSVRHLVEELRLALPGKPMVFSTVTPTGNAIVSSIAGKGDFVTYLPLDLSFIVRKCLRSFDPAALVIVETEIWPNLIYWASRKKIPVIVVNGRISDVSFRGYKKISFLLAPLLNRVSAFCVQSESDARKLEALGLAPGKARVTGNMKFDLKVKDYDGLKKDYHDYRGDFGLGGSERLWVAASTHYGEEDICLDAFLRLRTEFPELRLLIAPRHPERTPEVEEAVRRRELKPVRISSLARPPAPDAGGKAREGNGEKVFILDTVGKLMYFYAIADIVFVGGSLVGKGGHNILEPASLGKPIIFGPHMFNFRDIAALFIERKAALTVSGAGELDSAVALLLKDASAASSLAAAGRAIIDGNRGATSRNREAIISLLSSGPL